MFKSVSLAEQELEKKETEYFLLSNKMAEYKARLAAREKELKQLQEKTARLVLSVLNYKLDSFYFQFGGKHLRKPHDG
jgi:hypothetical protein